MTGEQAALTGIASATEHAAELRSRGDDPTPRGVVRASLAGAMRHVMTVLLRTDAGARVLMYRLRELPSVVIISADRPLRVLDVCAGYGCWASELSRWWVLDLGLPREWLHITGVEIHAPREAHLDKWCDDWGLDDWRVALGPASGLDHTSFDLVIGNPDFAQLLRDNAGAFVEPDQTMPAVLLRHAPAVLLLHTQQALLKSKAGCACWREYPPAASWMVPGGVKFRGARIGADQRCYQVTLWLRSHAGPCSTYMLEDLEPHERAWSVLPGSEDPSADLPARPGWTP